MRPMDNLYLSLLGRFEVTHEDRPLTAFRSDKIRALLAYLALEADTPHRREILATLFWPDYDHTAALCNLRKSLYRLRQTLDTHTPDLSTSVLTITRQTVQLNSTAVSLDVRMFEQNLQTVETHAHDTLTRCSPCLAQLTDAATLYQGELLAGFSLPDAIRFEEWVLVRREMLHQKTLNMLHTLSVTYERQNDFAQAYSYAMRQTELEPWREEAHRQLMRILARQGERSRALAQYETCCQLLLAELGVAPSSKTVALYEQIEQGAFPDDHEDTVAVSLHHFPTQFTPFVGRDEEVTTLVEHLLNKACRLLTLTGSGGVGKTRLTLQAGQHLAQDHAPIAQELFSDGIYFIPLAHVYTDEQLVMAMGKALQLTFQATEPPQQQLWHYLSDKKILLLLDNFEQLVTETAVFITNLLHTAPHLQLLISSREALQLQAEWQLRLDGLTYPPLQANIESIVPADVQSYAAVHLFVQAAQRTHSSFQPDETEWRALIHICQLTQGIPLALEIAAAWIRMMDCATIAEQIGRNLDFLSTPRRDVPDRHRSMRAVFAQSWQYLAPSEQVTLAQISLFQGGFDLPAALSILQNALQELSGLLDKSLLRREKNGRYHIHELLRQFSAGKLAELGDNIAQETAVSHMHYYLNVVATQNEAFAHLDTSADWQAVATNIDNIHQAWRWATVNAQGNALGNALDGLVLFYQLHGLFQEGTAVLAETISSLETLPTPHPENQHLLNTIRLRQVKLLMAQQKFPQAQSLIATVCHAFRELGDCEQQCVALGEQGIICWRLGDIEHATQLLSESQTLAETLHMPHQSAHAQHHLGNIAIMQGETEKAFSLMQDALTLYEKAGDQRNLANVFTDLGSLHSVTGNIKVARAYYQRSIALYRQTKDRVGVIIPLSNLGYLALLEADYDATEKYTSEILPFIQKSGMMELYAQQFVYLGHVALMRKSYTMAVQQYAQGWQITVGSFMIAYELLLGLTAVTVAVGNASDATQLLAIVNTVRTNEQKIIDPFEQILHQQITDGLHGHLSTQEWETAVALGKQMSIAEGIALALDQQISA